MSSQCLQEYQWAIGTTPGGQDIQNYTSTGLYPTGKNDQLYGVITHNVRYYASYKCVNGGGLVTTFEDPTGGKHRVLVAIPPDGYSLTGSTGWV